MLMFIFLLSIAVLLFCIIKLKLNAFVALLVTAYGTGILCQMSLLDVTNVVTDKFGSTLGGIGIVTGLGVMLGMFMYESGGIDNIANGILKKLGDNRSQFAVAVSGFITGIPVFGDVVYIMFAPMLRVLSKRTGYSMTGYACAISVATTCTFALVLPTAPPLAVAENMGISVGIFFFYALISAFVGMIVGGIIYGGILNKIDHKRGKTWDFSDMDAEIKAAAEETGKNDRPKMGAMKALSILLVPIILILLGSFAPLFMGEGFVLDLLSFLGSKNVSMTIGVLYGAIISRRYLPRSITDIMSDGADKVGLILLITGAGGAYGGILQASGIADFITGFFGNFNIPILVLCFVISQVLRCAQGSTTVALTTTSAIMASAAASSGVSPILCAIAICAGGIGLSLPNDSGFWAISRFFHIDVTDTIRGWTLGGFVAGVAILIFVCILSLFQGVLPGLL
ncbi:GntP family permease [Pseudoflavonifractor phocaeensis]|uniref:GntP family permease n=1 Tax=Pseudoflavonifractor phocaeensis TaxID=1870988 RepID=UPI0019583CBC|nr:GntP family permease [Pseudoflavonifractor phocaeensis]MBM6870195.1 GntP family permease [Pseudoflavonifractor phocaeensis]MBM6938113.1 GntP family permease [Pseudoflavonifractor phocaeensis]